MFNRDGIGTWYGNFRGFNGFLWESKGCDSKVIIKQRRTRIKQAGSRGESASGGKAAYAADRPPKSESCICSLLTGR